MPALDEPRRLGERPLEDRRRVDRRVVGQSIHHDLADDRPDAVRLGRPERGVEAGLVDRPVHERRGRAGGGDGSPRGRRDPGGRDLVEPPLEREDVALEPGQEVEAGTDAGIGELGQVRMQVDHARHDHPWPKVDDRRGFTERLDVGAEGGDPARRVDLEHGVRLVPRPAVVERGQDPGADRERRVDGQVHRDRLAGSKRPGSGDPGRSGSGAGGASASCRGPRRGGPSTRSRCGRSSRSCRAIRRCR